MKDGLLFVVCAARRALDRIEDRLVGPIDPTPWCDECESEDHSEHGCAGSAFGKRECWDRIERERSPLTEVRWCVACEENVPADRDGHCKRPMCGSGTLVAR